MKKMKLGALFGLLFATLQATTADAAQGFAVEGLVTSLAITDNFSHNNGDTDVILELTFNAEGYDCSTTRQPTTHLYAIHKAQTPGGFDFFVRTAQQAYLSGRKLRYQAFRSSSTVCRPEFMQLL